jgi:hypothetical protein
MAREDVVVRKLFGVGLVVAALTVGAPQPATAGCTTDLIDCYYAAAAVDDFWRRWAAGIDCELDYVECVRIKIIGV